MGRVRADLTVAEARASMTAAVAAVQERVDAELATQPGPRVLDLGCGSELRVRLPTGAWVVGVDEDEVALTRNPRVDEIIIADLAAWEPPTEAFDLVVCWWVLEHLAQPRRALTRLARATRPGGLVLLSVPNLRSPKSLVAKVTPYRFHVWLFRRVLRRPHAGTPGYAPYPTTLRLEISPRTLLAEVERQGLEVLHLGWFEDPKQRRIRHRLRVTGPAWSAVRAAVRALSLGRLDAARTDLVVLLRRPPEPAADPA